MRRFFLRLANLFRSDEAERQLAREVESHLGMLEDEFRRRGMSADDARMAARRAFHGVEQAKEMQRDARSFGWLDDAKRDVGYGLRTLRRAPGFTTVAILTLALGIGAATVIYSVVRNVVLDPFPYSRSDRMVNVLLKDAIRSHRPRPLFLRRRSFSIIRSRRRRSKTSSAPAWITSFGAAMPAPSAC